MVTKEYLDKMIDRVIAEGITPDMSSLYCSLDYDSRLIIRCFLLYDYLRYLNDKAVECYNSQLKK